MKLNKYLLGFSAAAFIATAAMAQTPNESQWVKQHTNVKGLQRLQAKTAKKYKKERQQVRAYLQAHPSAAMIVEADGSHSALVRIDEKGNPIYYTTFNLKSAQTIGTDELHQGGSLNLSLAGEGMIAGVWDGGKVQGAHELLDGKVTYKDNASSYADHGTHVSGTMVGKKLTAGQSVLAKGMAYKADLWAYDWFSDGTEMSAAAQDGLLVSNHSYGIDLSEVNDPSNFFGVYGGKSVLIDNIAWLAPYYTIVAAAGNDRGAGYNTADGGFNILGAEFTTAKNDIVVAAVKKVLDYSGPSSVEMSYFSSWGPTKDRRIKPDISADGVSVFSSIAKDPATGQLSTDSYGFMSGTSMASPSVAGSLLLLQELSADLHDGAYMKSATVKAIIFQTALEAGSSPGPDAKFGWGLLNMKGAAQLMLDDYNEVGSFYAELTLQDGGTYTKSIEANADGEVKVTIVWTDPAGTPNNPALVNDLDMRITSSDGTVYYPWRLHDYLNYKPALNDGDNDVDNVEQIVIPGAVAGDTYTITVTHKGSLEFGNTQDFSIAATGTKPLGVASHVLKDVSVYPNPASSQFTLEIPKAGAQVQVAVYDINGQKVLEENYNASASLSESIDVANLTSGIYFVKIETDGKNTTKKLIVK